ncbi:MAG TPA: MOSC domain-containing protein [Gaiellaceae bacterium]|nr:MOSC domain-containing protein [Gaiellaceae bacterium]
MSPAAERHPTTAELEAGLEHVRGAPADVGRVELVLRRPTEGEREILEAAELTPEDGVVGDRWSRGRRHRPPNPETQLTLMSARAAELVSAGQRQRWALAGDQLYVDLDLSEANLPTGTRLAVGSAVVELTPPPHTGCKKFVQRFGLDAMRFVNSPEGRSLRLRGANARVVERGLVRPGDEIRKLG